MEWDRPWLELLYLEIGALHTHRVDNDGVYLMLFLHGLSEFMDAEILALYLVWSKYPIIARKLLLQSCIVCNIRMNPGDLEMDLNQGWFIEGWVLWAIYSASS